MTLSIGESQEAEVATGLEAGTGPEQDSGQGGILVEGRKPEGPLSAFQPGFLPEGSLTPAAGPPSFRTPMAFAPPAPQHRSVHSEPSLSLALSVPCPQTFSPSVAGREGAALCGCWGTEPAARAVSAHQGEGYLCPPEVDGSGGSGCGLH